MLDTIFLQVLTMSYTASYVILAVLLARILLKKAPKGFSYALWSVVLFRLVCPWSFESVFSLLSLGRKTTEQLQPLPRQFTPLGTVHNNINTKGAGTIPSPTPSVPEEPTLSNIFVLIWLLGIATLLIYSIFMLVKLKKQLKGATLDTKNIYLSAHLATPFVMGVIHPKIYLPLFLSETEKRYILLHEQTHIRRFDHIIKLVSFFVLCVHWFNPLVWLAFFLSGRDMEMSCDEVVIKKLGNKVKKEYSVSLLSLSTGRRIIGGIPLAFGEGDTKSRIKNVLNYRKPAFWIIVLSMIVVVAACVGLALNPKSEETPPDYGDSMRTNDTIGTVSEATPTPQSELAFFVKPDEPAQVIGETAAIIWLKSYMEESVPLMERISDYTINTVTVIAGTPREGQSWADMKYHYVVQVDYDITTASDKYFAPGDGVSGKGTFKGLFRELYVKSLDGGNFNILGSGTGGGEQEFIDPLELALSAAILEQEKGNSDSEFVCESHVTLATEGSSPADNNNNIDTLTVYAMVLIQKFNYADDGLKIVGGSHIPTAITFNITESGEYTLKEYWIPRDGSYYAPDIKEKFPSAILDDALDTQKYILAQVQNCYSQAVNYKQLNTVPIIENLFESLMSSPTDSSNPNDYMNALVYRELTYYGDYTLRYVFSEFLKGGQTGLKGHLMWIVMDDLIGDESIALTGDNGQEYFDAWCQHAQKKLSSIGEDEMRENYPKSYLMLEMLSDMK